MINRPMLPARIGRFIVIGLFICCLAAILCFALEPNTHGSRLHELPRPVARWLNEHDDFANILAFAIFGSIVFLLPSYSSKNSSAWKVVLATVFSDLSRLALLLALVSGLEVAQLWIPGRSSELRDVATGSTGVLFAWALHRWRHIGGR